MSQSKLEILDYSDWKRVYEWRCESGNWKQSKQVSNSSIFEDATFPFYDHHLCPFCQKAAPEAYRGWYYVVDRLEVGHTSWTDDTVSEFAYICPCGWWNTQIHELGEPDKLLSVTRTVGILRRFALESLEVPLNALRRHLTR